MKRRYAIIFVLLLVAILILVGANIYLFNQARRYYTDLNEVRLDPLGLNIDPPDVISTTDKIKVLFYGDSRAANWPAPNVEGRLTFLNRGIDGQTTAQVNLRFPYAVQPLKPQVIILQVGINDLKTIPLFPERKAAIIAACEDNIRQIVASANDIGATVILTTIFPVGDVPLERQIFWSGDVKIAVAEVNDYIRTLAAKHTIILDTYSILAESNGLMKSHYSNDELHINIAGYNALNDTLLAALKKL